MGYTFGSTNMASWLFVVTVIIHLKSSTAQSYVGYSCVDRQAGCLQWAKQGQCDSNPKFMIPQCCASCVATCADTRTNCADAAAKGYCNNIQWLNACKMSCGMCCSDYNAKCREWAEKNQCATNPRFMLTNCMRSCQACSSPCKPCTAEQYMERWTIEGFHIRSEQGVFYRWPKLTTALKEDLRMLKALIPEPAAKLLQTYSGIYISKLKLCSSYPTCSPPDGADAYHVSPTWLKRNHDTPAKGGFVDLQNPGEYMIRRSNVEKYNLLHECFHAWFDIRRRAGMVGDNDSQRKFDAVKRAYKNALARGLYIKVQFASGGFRPGYQRVSEWEYMAELSEAYFARGQAQNDYYPFNRPQLQQYDPTGFQAIQYVWSAPFPTKIAVAGP